MNTWSKTARQIPKTDQSTNQPTSNALTHRPDSKHTIVNEYSYMTKLRKKWMTNNWTWRQIENNAKFLFLAARGGVSEAPLRTLPVGNSLWFFLCGKFNGASIPPWKIRHVSLRLMLNLILQKRTTKHRTKKMEKIRNSSFSWRAGGFERPP